ncbi:MAG: SAP domain-containing protein [Planctomycetota bacterium]
MPAVKTAEKSLKMPEIRAKAKSLGLTPGKMKKAGLIHAIQTAEGNTPCFGRSGGHCSQTECCFMKDCLRISL